MEEKEATIEMKRNWADLPPQIFLLILEKLPEICDFIRSRAVCKPWHSSSSVSNLPRQFPWIIRLNKGPDLELYSIAFKKIYTIRARCCSSKSLFGAAGGYMLTGKEGNAGSFSLLNPLNNREVPLPVLRDCDPHLFPYNFSWFSPTSFQSDDYMLTTDYDISVGCKPGDDSWDIIGPGHESQYIYYYLKGLLFRFEDGTGITKVMDIGSRKELYVIQPFKLYAKIPEMSFRGPYFVESCGEILVVCYNQSYKKMDYKFYIHRLEFGNGKGNPYWIKLSSIGDRILFFDIPLGNGRGFSLRASDFVGFRGNIIYFINKLPAFHLGYVHVINMYDIENGKTISMDNPFDQKNHITWFRPTLNHI